MNANRGWIRASYWVAAVADFGIAVLVLVPSRMGVPGYVYPMGLISAAAFSWGVMLAVADRKPEERSWMLGPTALVVFLLGVAVTHAGVAGLIPVARMVATLIVVLFVLCLLLITLHKIYRVR